MATTCPRLRVRAENSRTTTTTSPYQPSTSSETNDMEKLGQTIEQWEREVRDYENMCKKALDEEIKIGVL
eukprot:1314227-Amphidinium_carterae.1